MPTIILSLLVTVRQWRGEREGRGGEGGGREGGRGQTHRLNVCIQKYHLLSLQEATW